MKTELIKAQGILSALHGEQIRLLQAAQRALQEAVPTNYYAEWKLRRMRFHQSIDYAVTCIDQAKELMKECDVAATEMERLEKEERTAQVKQAPRAL
jgi:hypothetical protein